MHTHQLALPFCFSVHICRLTFLVSSLFYEEAQKHSSSFGFFHPLVEITLPIKTSKTSDCFLLHSNVMAWFQTYRIVILTLENLVFLCEVTVRIHTEIHTPLHALPHKNLHLSRLIAELFPPVPSAAFLRRDCRRFHSRNHWLTGHDSLAHPCREPTS